jgi:hypothetical protein
VIVDAMSWQLACDDAAPDGVHEANMTPATIRADTAGSAPRSHTQVTRSGRSVSGAATRRGAVGAVMKARQEIRGLHDLRGDGLADLRATSGRTLV